MTRVYITILAMVVATMMANSVILTGQAQDGWTVPRTPDGRPDLNGIWASNAATPLQRPEELGNRTVLTDEEVAAIQEHVTSYSTSTGNPLFGDGPFLRGLASLDAPPEDIATTAAPPKPTLLPRGRGTGGYGHQWMGDRWYDNRTSLIIDPKNGRLPPRSVEAKERTKRQLEARNTPPTQFTSVSEELDQLDRGVRCRGGNPLLSGRGYNSNYQIFQTTDYIGIQIEMHHETRLIPIGNAVPTQLGPPSVTGSSYGHWDGDTLVVKTTNLSRGPNGSTPNVRVTERFRLVGPNELEYEFTLDDPSTWTQPWTARIFLRPAPGTGVIYEYACHEGNYAAELSLRSTRAIEKQEE